MKTAIIIGIVIIITLIGITIGVTHAGEWDQWSETYLFGNSYQPSYAQQWNQQQQQNARDIAESRERIERARREAERQLNERLRNNKVERSKFKW